MHVFNWCVLQKERLGERGKIIKGPLQWQEVPQLSDKGSHLKMLYHQAVVPSPEDHITKDHEGIW